MTTDSVSGAVPVSGPGGGKAHHETPPALNPEPAVRSASRDDTAHHKTREVAVLLVDDEPALLEIGKAFLERTPGITVTTAESASRALVLMAGRTFDAVVSDYQMPGMHGIAFLREVRTTNMTIPFIIFTGKGREEIVIEALNSGADGYIQKGGDPRAQYVELAHKILRSVRQRRAEAALVRKHEILQAILAASPHGIGFVRNRTFQWVNHSLAGILGYQPGELKGMHLQHLYENADTYKKIGEQIQAELKSSGRARIITRFRHRAGFSTEYEIHIAPLDRGNLHYGHMIMVTDISDRLAVARTIPHPTGFPHLELSPVIELDLEGRITYYNRAAMDTIVRFGTRGMLEEFFPRDIRSILRQMDTSPTGSFFRDVTIGLARFRVHITLSPQFRVVRLSAARYGEDRA